MHTTNNFCRALTSLMALLPLAAPAQLAVPAGSTLSVGSGGTLSVLGAVLNAGTISNQGAVQLTGNLSSTGTLSGTAGQLKLTGTGAPQTLNITSLVPALEVLNPQGATLAAPLRVRALALTGGAIRLGAHTLTSVTGGSITGVDGAAGRFIITDGAGMLQQLVGSTPRLFPTGASTTSYAPATLTRSAGTELYELRTANGFLSNGSTGTPLTTDAVGLHWELTPPDAVPFALMVQWQATDELSNFNRAQSALGRWNGTAYGLAEAFGPVGGPPPYGRTVSGLTSAGPYVVLDRQAPLPVELTRFEATRPAGQPRVLLSWATASEKNNAGFEVQRQDEGQTTFRRVGFVAGRGTSTAATEYTFQDLNDFRGLSYYRLRQLDHDGTESFSPVRAVAGLASGTPFSLAAYPNPVAAQAPLTLEITGPLPKDLQLTLYAADGRVVYRLSWPIGQTQHKLSADLPAGAYWLRYHAANGTTGTLPLLVSE
ncbi:T9SS type A sorting domain-containing protein [Hymenobacter sp. BT186]|uniref:T9SS type A sorting domain-containing protein n=1 Tax=Hymenobacter telluris TaxID=2816474 RepID=A0A939EUT2_9BACT|nr:T9SS type A sorting domain-containing protein [Hymenobacter telluris]MBO0357617.1 T9SS type A sorting domain-containing protein [Hymenobacter telluris]MBW3373643.1 T9SS type A sorting domain-containing protein [Hymenobacter norwichensis]